MATPKVYNPNDNKSPSMWRVAAEIFSTLQFKATTLVVFLTLTVTVAVSGYLLRSSGRLAREQREEQLVNAASLLAGAASTILDSGDHDGLTELARLHADGHPLIYVIFSDPNGDQLAVAESRTMAVLQKLATDKGRVPVPGVPLLLSDSSTNRQAATPLFLDVTYPITHMETDPESGKAHPTELLGYVRTGMKSDMWQTSMSDKLDLVVGVGVLALLAAVPLGFVVIRRIVAPLDGLADTMLEFSQGKLDVRSPVVRKDEIGRLSTAFNQMADQHQQTHRRMRRLNAELEERVAHRTQQLRELASRDALTGLYNRRFFNDTMERRFAEALRYGDDLACVMIDLDNFKHANDTFGHQVGDELLLLTSRTMLSQLRSADVAARFGGDEFVILLPQTDSNQAKIMAQRIVERFTEELNERFPDVQVSMSLGIASLLTTHSKDAESFIRDADHALYDAKALGKNQLCVAGEEHDTPAGSASNS